MRFQATKKTWKKLKCLLLSERGQSKKATDYLIPTAWYSGKSKVIEIVKKKNSGCQGLRVREGEEAQGIFRSGKPFCVVL